MSFSGNDGPVICMAAPPMILSASLGHYSAESRGSSPRSTPPPTLSLREQLIGHINLLRDMHLALHQEIAERNYRAEGEIKKSKNEVSAIPSSPSKMEVQDPLKRFYEDKVQKMPLELPTRLERTHMALISKLITAFEDKITQTEREFRSLTSLREEGLKALILNDFKGDEITHRTAIAAYRADLAKFHSEIPGKIQPLRERVQEIRECAGNNCVHS